MPSKTLVVLQSSYIPWKGYFDLMNMADEFIIFDDAQFTKNDWRNRNRIKTPTGVNWLTIPIRHRFGQKISETVVSDPRWRMKHWKTISQNYVRASYFVEYKEKVEELYLGAEQENLSEINHRFLKSIAEMLGIALEISWSHQYRIEGGKTDRLVNLCRQARATKYLSGPTARGYIDPSAFEKAGIQLEYFDYSGYPEYPQIYEPFDHYVSVLDLIFNVGPEATRYMKSFNN